MAGIMGHGQRRGKRRAGVARRLLAPSLTMSLRALLVPLVVGLLLAGCGSKSNVLVRKLEAAAPRPTPRPKPQATPKPPPKKSPNSLTVAGDIAIQDPAPEVVAMTNDPGADASKMHLRLEVRHRPQGSSQADSVLVFFNVPPHAGEYALHAPEDPPVPGRVYAYFTARGSAVGSMKDFNTAIAGRLTLTRQGDDGLAGSFEFAGQEPPPPPPPAPSPGKRAPVIVGTIPPAPPARVQVTGTLLARLSELQSDETAQF